MFFASRLPAAPTPTNDSAPQAIRSSISIIVPGAPIGAKATVIPPLLLSTVRSQNVLANMVLGAGVASNSFASFSPQLSVQVSRTFVPTRMSLNDKLRALRRP